MKKLFLSLCILFSLATFASAQDYFGLHFSVPYIYQNWVEDDFKYQSNTNAIGFGLHYITIPEDSRVGGIGMADLYFPQKIKTKVTLMGYTGEGVVKRKDYKSLWGLNIFGGGAFALIKAPTVRLTLGPGVHYRLLYSKIGDYATVDNSIGLGLDAQLSISFFPSTYFTAGGNATFDFFEFYRTEDESKSRPVRTLMLTPRIGFGVQF